MKEITSNGIVENSIDQLRWIKVQEVPEGLYGKVLSGIRLRQENKISPLWLRAAALLFALLISAELLLLKQEAKESQTKTLQSMLPVQANTLYHD